MKTKIIKILGIIIIVFIFFRIIVISLLHYINLGSSHFLAVEQNELLINKPIQNQLYIIEDSIKIIDNHKIFYIKSNTNEEIILLINNLTFPHQIYVNDKLQFQNINKRKVNYDADYAYKTIHVNPNDYINNTVKISISGPRLDKVNLYLGTSEVIKDQLEIRTIIYVVLIVFLFVCTITSLILYLNHKKNFYYLIFTTMGIVSILKSIVLGELFVLSDLFGFNAYNYPFIDNLTTIINTIIPLFILCYIFDFKVKLKYIIIGSVLLIILSSQILFTNGIILNFYFALFFITFILSNLLLLLAYIRNKPFHKIMILVSIFYSSNVLYYLLVLNRRLSFGSLLFYINPAYLGATFYMIAFFFTILLKHFIKVKNLENQSKELERILLLRGISHDLRLPLSIIKLNHQIMKDYHLTNEEIKAYIKSSLEATLEIEKMTENINSYLNLKQTNTENQIMSIKACMENMRDYYKVYNKDQETVYIEINSQDCFLQINSLYFKRMLYNLIDNALKYNKNAQVEVNVKYHIDQYLNIIVSDNGTGMSQEQISHVFTPFYQADSSRNSSGLGLGLSVVKEVVDLLKGKIDITSKLGEGTTITIIIPK